ncbi:MAG TPA: cob(I)yrinic acid a,c-diamide adenosyltransferase [Bacteriovoracaceae bacterium]|nr:cob(I)yrinic acid a,c-diamide adenosyltransferase [Bacteriovoracaceae bacterium]
MKKSGIYTKTGDKGETGLVSGNRALKSDIRIDLYGDLDELNSRIGIVCAEVKEQRVLNFLQTVQSAIFDLGSNLACEVENRQKYKLPQLTEGLVKELELEIDKLDNALEPLKNFVLPGGSKSASLAHLCRTGTRSVERKLIHFQQTTKEELPAHSVEFLNRLSDYFFVLARHLNKVEGVKEILWQARQTQ